MVTNDVTRPHWSSTIIINHYCLPSLTTIINQPRWSAIIQSTHKACWLGFASTSQLTLPALASWKTNTCFWATMMTIMWWMLKSDSDDMRLYCFCCRWWWDDIVIECRSFALRNKDVNKCCVRMWQRFPGEFTASWIDAHTSKQRGRHISIETARPSAVWTMVEAYTS